MIDCKHPDRTFIAILDEGADEPGEPKKVLGWGVWCKSCGNVLAVAPVRPEVADIEF